MITGTDTVIPWFPLPELITTGSSQPLIRASEPAAAYALALRGEPIGIISFTSSTYVPIGMGHSEVATVCHVINMFEIVGQITEVGWLGRTNASASSKEVGCDGARRPLIDGASAAASLTGMLLWVLRLIERESSCRCLAVDIIRAWPIAMLAAWHIFHARRRTVACAPRPKPRGF